MHRIDKEIAVELLEMMFGIDVDVAECFYGLITDV